MSGEGGMVRGVLVTRGFAGRIALPVQNHPPDVGLSAGNRFLLLAMCFVVAESPSGYKMTLPVQNRPPDCLGDAGFWRFWEGGSVWGGWNG